MSKIKSKQHYYKSMRILSLVAIACTIIMALFTLATKCLPIDIAHDLLKPILSTTYENNVDISPILSSQSNPNNPTKLIAKCNISHQSPNALVLISLKYDNGELATTDVEWTVTSGIAILFDEIDNQLGFIPQSYTDVTIRFVSKTYPSIYTDVHITINMQAFLKDPQKIVGHILPFFLMGLGLTAICIMLIKKRCVSLTTPFIILTIISGITELIQSLLPERSSSIADFGLDMIAGILGILLTTIIYLICKYTYKAKRPYDYFAISDAYTLINVKNIFKNPNKVIE